MGHSKDCQVDGSCESRTPQNTTQEEAPAYQGGWGGQEQQEAWGSQGHQGGQQRLGWGDQLANNKLVDRSFPEQAFSNVLGPVEGVKRGFSARGPEKRLFGPRAALGGGRKRGAWSLGGPPAELLTLIKQLE